MVKYSKVNIPGFDYEVGDDGSVRHTTTDKVLVPFRKHNTVDMWNDNGVRITRKIDELVLEAFVGEGDRKDPEIMHLNGRKHDNRLSNLKYKEVIVKSDYCVFYKADGEVRSYNPHTDTFQTTACVPVDNTPWFEMLGHGYDASDDSLRRYAADFKQWNHELMNNKQVAIVYSKYYSDRAAVQLTFNRLCKESLRTFPAIEYTEHTWMRSTFNAGLFYGKPGTYDFAYAYDFKSFYPTTLCDPEVEFKIPNGPGAQTKLKRLPEKATDLRYGFYKVVIRSEHPDVCKVFSFSKSDTYTHISLAFAMRQKERFNFTIKLNKSAEYNAYLYDEQSLVPTEKIFGQWFRTLSAIREQYPKNKLVKHLSSSIVGHLSQIKRVTCDENQIGDYDVSVNADDDGSEYIVDNITYHADGSECFYLMKRNDCYRCNFRLQPFLTAQARVLIARVALKNIDKVVRIQTDGIVLTECLYSRVPNLFAEPKYTTKRGEQLVIKHVNDLKKISK